MSLVRLRQSVCPLLRPQRRTLVAKALANSEEYTETAVYPPILDTSPAANRQRVRESWHSHIESLNTVEEKLIAVNMPRYYGYKTAMIDDKQVLYNCMPFIKHCTRTYFEEADTLPASYKSNENVASQLAKRIRSEVEDALVFEREALKHSKIEKDTPPAEVERILASATVAQLNRVLLGSLVADTPHLGAVEIDLAPRHEAFWFIGGMDPPELVRKFRKSNKWQKDGIDDPVNRMVQYQGTPYLALRHSMPLPSTAADSAEYENSEKQVERFSFDPRTIGYSHSYRHGTTIPGFWPGSPHEFGLLSYQSRSNLLSFAPNTFDQQEMLHVLGIQSSYAWLLGQACYQGFSTFNELTYPLSTQTMVTDGRCWSFYVYQLNTTALHIDRIETNSRVNLCWGTGEQKLYDTIDESGRIVGFNEDVLRNIIQFYMNAPEQRSSIDMKPYLGDRERRAADIKDEARREFVETRFKHIMSNRPKHMPVPEVHNWEKIYKIDNNTRALAPKRRPFELYVNPYRRRLDDHTPPYIPKAVRPDGPKSKKRWSPTFYP